MSAIKGKKAVVASRKTCFGCLPALGLCVVSLLSFTQLFLPVTLVGTSVRSSLIGGVRAPLK